MIYFFLFALVLFGSYVSVRRELAPIRPVAMVGTVASIIALTLFLIEERNATVVYGVIVGIVAGGLFSGLTLMVAWYFHTSEAETRSRRAEIDQLRSDDL